MGGHGSPLCDTTSFDEQVIKGGYHIIKFYKTRQSDLIREQFGRLCNSELFRVSILQLIT